MRKSRILNDRASRERAGRAARRRLTHGEWTFWEAAMCGAIRKGKALAVMVMPGFDGTYGVMALETPVDGRTTVESVLDNHSHQIIAERVPDVRKAKLLAERFLRSWKRGKPALPPPEACGCGPIVDGPPPEGIPVAMGAPAGFRPPPPLNHWVPTTGGGFALVMPDGTVLGHYDPSGVLMPATAPKGLLTMGPAKSSKSRPVARAV